MRTGTPNIGFERQHLLATLRDAQGERCSICSGALPLAKTVRDQNNRMRCTLDHVYPLDTGGHDGRGNVLAAHAKCNNRKGALWPTDEQLALLEEVNAILGWRTIVPEPMSAGGPIGRQA